MKIGIDARSINLHSGSGIGTYTKNLIKNLISMNSKDEFDLLWTGLNEEEFTKDNTKLFHISGRYSSFYEKEYIPAIMEHENVNLYHIPQNGIGLSFIPGLKTVVTIHDLIPYVMPETVGKGYLNKFLNEMPKIISSVSGILTVSEHSKKDIMKFFPNFPKDKIYVTPLAANKSFKPLIKERCIKYINKHFDISNPFILYVGGFSKRKNVKNLIDCYKEVKKDLNKPYKLVLLGSITDSGPELKQYVKSINLEDDILFLGYVDDYYLPIFYNACEAFVYPSLYEGFGLPPLEAMSCKTPVITSNVTSIPEVTGDSAILIDPNSKFELSNALLSLLNNEETKLSYSEKGYKQSLQFSWRLTSEKTYNAYNKILETN